MSVQPVQPPPVELKCDECGKFAGDGENYDHGWFADEDVARDVARDQDWTSDGTSDWCMDCRYKTHEHVDDGGGDCVRCRLDMDDLAEEAVGQEATS